MAWRASSPAGPYSALPARGWVGIAGGVTFRSAPERRVN